MGYFSEKTRVRIDAKQGIVRISIRADETSVEEFVYPFEETDNFIEAIRAGLNFSSKYFKSIFKQQKIFLQFRENAFKVKIFNFNQSELQMFCAQFASERIKIEKLDPKERATVVDICDDIMSLSVSLNKHFENLFKEVRVASQLPFDLEPYLQSIDNRLESIEKTLKDKGINVTVQQTGTAPLSSRSSDRFSMDDEYFIPDNFKEDFEGKINTQKTEEASSTESAAEALKKLKNRNKKS
jgi:hypothetical protein